MSFNLMHIWATMGIFSKLIAGVLVVMAVLSIGVVLERIWVFARSSRESQKFARQANPLIASWDLEKLMDVAKGYKHSVLATLVTAGTRRYVAGIEDGEGGLSPVELARREMARQQEHMGAELRRGLGVLASIGSVAPFVGLLGTVVGIITAFQGIASTGSGGLGAVSAGIAEALVETALGLLVAIPAVLCFNYLSTRVAGIEQSLARTAGELVDEMENEYGRSGEFPTLERKAA